MYCVRAGFEDSVLSVDDAVISSLTLNVPVVRSGGSFGVVEVHWNASVAGMTRHLTPLTSACCRCLWL